MLRVVGEPQRLAGIGRRRVARGRRRGRTQRVAVPVHAALGRQDRPAHLREAAHEERRGRLDDVVLRLEPGDVQRRRAGAVDRSRKRTKAVILCLSRRTAWAMLLARAPGRGRAGRGAGRARARRRQSRRYSRPKRSGSRCSTHARASRHSREAAGTRRRRRRRAGAAGAGRSSRRRTGRRRRAGVACHCTSTSGATPWPRCSARAARGSRRSRPAAASAHALPISRHQARLEQRVCGRRQSRACARHARRCARRRAAPRAVVRRARRRAAPCAAARAAAQVVAAQPRAPGAPPAAARPPCTPSPGTRSSISRGARFRSTGNCSRCASAQASFGSTSSDSMPSPRRHDLVVREAVEAHQPVGLVEPVLAHQRRRLRAAARAGRRGSG